MTAMVMKKEAIFLSGEEVPETLKRIHLPQQCDDKQMIRSRMKVGFLSNDISPVDEEMKRRLSRGYKRGRNSVYITQYMFNSIWDQNVPLTERVGRPSVEKRVCRYKLDQHPYQRKEFPVPESDASLGSIVDAIQDWDEEDKRRAAESLVLLKTEVN